MWKSIDWSGLIAIIAWIAQVTDAALPTRWENWWTYDGIAGPAFWGMYTLEYSLCAKGKHQSPVNIDPRRLVFDPNLEKLHITKQTGPWMLKNTGHDITVDPLGRDLVTIGGGPLSYNYSVAHIKLHFGALDTIGSEHTVNGTPFPAEMHFIGYNRDLFENFTRARTSPNGIVILSVLVQIHQRGNKEFQVITKELRNIPLKGNQTKLHALEIQKIIPQTEFYMTYHGSFTQPGCEEVVTWVLLNKPLYFSREQMNALRKLTKIQDPGQILMENNFRSPLPLYQRTIRTNINMEDPKCVVTKTLEYRLNNNFKPP
ncbi:carbonic anhydrase-related protein 10-like [Liolophura sinensis]|uniref:carbonic anhydrase-related protein 10-like n=1 Tax=Liolophura sinensis TaxID=3198878 RepID=UPI0031586123